MYIMRKKLKLISINLLVFLIGLLIVEFSLRFFFPNKTLQSKYLISESIIPVSHFNYELEYAPPQFTGSDNQSIIISRFSAPGGIETMTRGYQDFRSSEYSVYNTLGNRNLTVIKPTQGPSGTISETTGIRVSDINGEESGDRSGGAVSLSSDGTIVAIGAYGHSSSSGHVRIYEYKKS